LIEIPALIGIGFNFVPNEETEVSVIEEVASHHLGSVTAVHNVLVQHIDLVENHVNILIEDVVERLQE
jgi:hypothetical protein